MFIQVITAKVVDADRLARQIDRWEEEVRPGADGFLGSTAASPRRTAHRARPRCWTRPGWTSLRSRLGEFEAVMEGHRPDVVGDVTVVHPDASYTDAVYFSSEAEGRGPTRPKEPPPEMQAMFEE